MTETIIHLDGAKPLAVLEQVADRLWGRGPDWNDDDATTVSDVREWLGAGIDVTDADLAATFGPQWRAVVEVVRRAAVLTTDEARRLAAARGAARGAARAAAWDAGRAAARAAAGAAAWAAGGAAARDTAWYAAWAAVTWDLATADGPYTFAHRDLLMAPWVEVCGLPEGLIDTLGDA